MFRRVRFECGVCSAGFVDWHDEEWERTPVFCVECGEPILAGTPVDMDSGLPLPPRREAAPALGVLKPTGEGFPDTLRGLKAAQPPASAYGARAARRARAEARADAREVPPPSRPATRATSEAPGPLLSEAPEEHTATDLRAPVNRRGLAPIGAFLFGFAAGMPFALIGQSLLTTLHSPIARDARAPGSHGPSASLAQPSAVAAPTPALQVSSPAVPSSAPTPLAKPSLPIIKVPPSRLTLLTMARDKQRRAQLDDAQRLYESVLQARPSDSEARAGLAEVQLLRGHMIEARAAFEHALQSNENYVPAWVALGDIDWLNGRAELAACRYQLVVDRFPEGSYPPYITLRIASVLGSGARIPNADSATPSGCAR